MRTKGQKQGDDAGYSLAAFSSPPSPCSVPQNADVCGLHPTGSLAPQLLADFIERGTGGIWGGERGTRTGASSSCSLLGSFLAVAAFLSLRPTLFRDYNSFGDVMPQFSTSSSWSSLNYLSPHFLT